MKKHVFSLQRLAESKKIMRTACLVALCSVASPAYSGGLAGLVKGVSERTTLYLYAERNNAPLSPTTADRSGVAAIVYSPMAKQGVARTQSAVRTAAVARALDGRFVVTDLGVSRDYLANAASKADKKGINSGVVIGTTMVLLGVGLLAWMTNDDGNRPRD